MSKDQKGELARLAQRIAEIGGNIIRLTTLPAEDLAGLIVILKIEDVPQATLTDALSPLFEILDARQVLGWGAEGFSPYHWTLES